MSAGNCGSTVSILMSGPAMCRAPLSVELHAGCLRLIDEPSGNFDIMRDGLRRFRDAAPKRNLSALADLGANIGLLQRFRHHAVEALNDLLGRARRRPERSEDG